MACCVLVLVLLASSVSGTVVRVNSDTGNDTLCLQSGEDACRTLKHVASQFGSQPNFTILIETNITLHSVITFERTTGLTINGSSSIAGYQTQVQCSNRSMLYFRNVDKLTIANLNFILCGALNEETQIEAALYFIDSSDIAIWNTGVYKSRLSAIAFMSCSGSVLLEKVLLLHNGYKESSKKCFSFPAGLIIAITDSERYVNFMLKDSELQYNIGVQFDPTCYDRTLTNSQVYWNGRGLGGGLGVYFTGNSSGNTISIANTTVTGNYGKWGGGMYLMFQNFTSNNNVTVTDSSFFSNIADSSGGGVNVMYLNDEELESRTNRVWFSGVNFTNNTAKYGGGLAISSVYGNKKYTPGENLCFYQCLFRYNTAVYSPAVDVSPYFYKHFIQTGFLPIPIFSQVDVVDNRIYKEPQETTRLTTGVFSVTQFTVYFRGKITFSRNRFSALLLSSGHVLIEEGAQVSFTNNSDGEYNGGAIAIYGFSVIFISRNIYMEFVSNKAGQYGGGIYYHTSDQHTFITGTTCFLQYNEEGIPDNVTITFRGNEAVSGGSSIYADSFYSCLYNCPNNHKEHFITKDIMKCIGNVTLDDETENSTSIQSSSHKFDINETNCCNVSAIPGATKVIEFTIIDEFNQTLNPLLTIGSKHKTKLHVSPQYTLNKEITPYGQPKDKARLQFITQGIGGIFFHFNLTLLECPPGFYFQNTTMRCICAADSAKKLSLYSAIIYCNKNTFQAHMKRDHWAGYIPEKSTDFKDLYFAPCFQPLCNSSFLLPNISTGLESAVCFENRTNILCGKCIKNHSVYYHSKQFLCKPNHLCHWGPLFYLVSEILPVCLLFAFVVIFDFSFTSGNAVGFIFYCQYLDKLTVHTDSNVVTYLRQPYQLFYGIINFEYFTTDPLSFCLWKDFQILDIITFKYVTILAALALVLGLVSLLKSNRCGRLLKWRTKFTTKTSFIRGMSAFLVICYSQCTRNSFLILKFTRPIGWNDTAAGPYSYYGGLPFLGTSHLLYAIPAIISLIFITILPPLLLLIYPLSLHLLSLCNLSEHWIVNRIMRSKTVNRLMPFMDCFQSCYKDKLRFFAGIYFLYRVVILCTYTLFQTYYGYRVSAQIALTLFLGIHAVVQPYKKRLHNLIDSLIFLNLALINAISIYNDYQLDEINENHESKNTLMILTGIQLVLLYLPMTVASTYAVEKVVVYCRGRVQRKNYEMIEETRNSI